MKTTTFLVRVLSIFTLTGAAALAAPTDRPSAVSAADWSGLRAAYDAKRHAFVETSEGRFAAERPGVGWLAEFDDGGFVARTGDWTWGLELSAVGFGDEAAAVSGAAWVRADENRLAVKRADGIYEWFVNSAGGLQQGWTLTERPAGDSAGPGLGLELAVRGDLEPRVEAGAVSFVNADEAVVLTYGGLLAWDADGRRLPVEFVAAGDGGVRIEVDERGARYPVTIDPVAQEVLFKASSVDANDLFGAAVAISGNTAVVGAPQEDSNAVNVDGVATNDSSSNSGAAYVFVRTAVGWEFQAYLKASNTGDADGFGGAVAIDGNRVVVGAESEDDTVGNSGAAYVFRRTGTLWFPDGFLKASNAGGGDRFGISVAISGDTLVVGADFEDSASNGVGGAQGDTGTNVGAAYVFVRSGVAVWNQEAYLKATDSGDDDRFGTSVGLSGDRAVVGARRQDGFADDEGAAYVYVRTLGVWTPEAQLKASTPGADDEFGIAVAISGDTIVVGAPNEDSPATGVNGGEGDGANNAGAAYVFARSGALWPQQAYLKSSTNGVGNEFGTSVAISGDALIVGAEFEDSDSTGVNGSEVNLGAGNSGAAYVFRRVGGVWGQQSYLKASNTETDDRFGGAVGISGELALVGARLEDSIAFVPVNGPGLNNVNAPSSGAAYAFTITPEVVAPGVTDTKRPKLRVRGRKTIETLRKRVVIRGTASDASGIARIEVRAPGAKVAKAKVRGNGMVKVVLRVRKDRGRVIVKLRAVDGVGLKSKRAKVRILWR